MRKLSVILLGFIILQGLCFSAAAYREKLDYYEVGLSTSSTFQVSSYTLTTSSTNQNTLKRIFKINGTPTGTLFMQYGGSTTTVTSSGLPVENTQYIVEENYLGDIYFMTNTSTATLRMTEIIKR